jgi:putative ABC transport system permease protein
VILGVLSWLLAVPVSVPLARLLSDVIGEELIYTPLEFTYSVSGMLFWLLVVILLSALSSLGPALQATRVSVREALAYE